jgi:hypothetical protein
MLNGESWLLHSDLFEKHWVIEVKSWIRNLGWFSSLLNQTRADSGWSLFGDANLSILDYISIIDAPSSEKTLYMYKNGTWSYIHGPVLFVIKKTEEEVYIAGWAGDKKKISDYKKKYDSPWEWPHISIIEIIPAIANSKLFSVRQDEYFLSYDITTKFPVFFLSNGETNADKNWEHLKLICPRAERIDGISPRRSAFLECANLAEKSPYFFVVTGKNRVTDISVFDYIPDNTVPLAHIMFQAKNMSNGLEYGHMAIGCYNKSLILETPENFGLDLTEYGKIYPIPLTVSEAHFATSEYEAWRTAFRETIKLTLKDTNIAKKWLNQWLNVAQGDYADWVLRGANDGHDYATEHKNNMNELLKTERWDWLEEYFTEKYGAAE